MPEDQLPEPHKVFVFGTSNMSFYRKPPTGYVFLWQGNPEMQPGDLAVLYQWKPASKIVSVWKAISLGFNDPVFRHHRMVCYSAIAGIPPVSWDELKVDPVFSQTNLVRSKMTQMDGAKLKNSEYMHLLEMSAKHGSIPSNIPSMPVYSEIKAPEIKLEQDVERFYLEEHLLPRLGWDGTDYVRQVPLRDGRGTHVFPDYVINYDDARKKGEIVLEAKLSIKTKKQAEHDKGQARAYAKLLDARALVLVSKEGIWIAEVYDDFTEMTSYSWDELQNADNFDYVYEIVGKGKKGKKSRKK